MARAWRIEYAGALYHVLSRGNEGRAIFVDDRQAFLTAERFPEAAGFVHVDAPEHAAKAASSEARAIKAEALMGEANKPPKPKRTETAA